MAEIGLSNKNVKDFYITFDKEEYMKERAELSSYLFIALFFVFTLLFIFASTILNIFIDSLRRLTLKINSLKDGNFNVNLGNLKKIFWRNKIFYNRVKGS